MDVSRAQALTETVTICEDPGALAAAWKRIETQCDHTPFQSLGFVEAWFRNVGLAGGERPLIVVFGPMEAPTFLLPLAVRTCGFLAVATYPGGPYATQNVGIGMPPDDALPRAVAALKAHGVDLLVLKDQPATVGPGANPLVDTQARLAPHPSFAADLDGDFAALMSRHGGGRKRHRLQAKLKAYGVGASLARAEDQATAHAWFDLFYQQKARRFAERGLPDAFGDPNVQKMFKELWQDLDIFSLSIDGSVAAVLVMARAGHTRHLLMSSFDAAFSRASPGESLLHLVLEACGQQGVSVVDFGPGAERYKAGWADRTVPLMESVVGITPAGRLASGLYRRWRLLRARLAASHRLRRVLNLLRRRGASGNGAD